MHSTREYVQREDLPLSMVVVSLHGDSDRYQHPLMDLHACRLQQYDKIRLDMSQADRQFGERSA